MKRKTNKTVQRKPRVGDAVLDEGDVDVIRFNGNDNARWWPFVCADFSTQIVTYPTNWSPEVGISLIDNATGRCLTKRTR